MKKGSYDLLNTAILTVASASRKGVEEVFRPLYHQPIDLRMITEHDIYDRTTGTLVYNPSCITENTPEARRNILHLLYAFREYFYDDITSSGVFPVPPQVKIMAARQAAQFVANIIDYLDDNNAATQGPFYNGTFVAADGITQLDYQSQRNPNPTFITRSIIRDLIREACIEYNIKNPMTPIPVIDIGQTASGNPFDFGLGLSDTMIPPFETFYGYERQPFISEVYSYNPGGKGVVDFAVELVNPYSNPVDLNGWNIKVGSQNNVITAAGYIVPAGTPASPGRLKTPELTS